MGVRLKRVEDQVIVITGASSGIGLATARMAAERGAKVVLVAREQEDLERIAADIRSIGGSAATVAADVADEEAMERAAETAIREFGGFDTWVNNAGTSVYGNIMDVPLADQRRIFETNYWGVVLGSRIAVRHLKDRGGALINIGSVLSDQAMPLQGVYSASKHAVKGFTDALRMELEAEHVPVSVTLIKPGAVDSLYEEHARTYLGAEPRNPPPVYAPEVAARAILHAAEHQVRDLVVGSGGKALSMMGRYAPRLGDRLLGRAMVRFQRGGPITGMRRDNLYEPARDGRVHGQRHAMVRRHSVYTEAAMHPMTAAAIVAGLGALAFAAMSQLAPRARGHGPQGPAMSYGPARRVGGSQFGYPPPRQVGRAAEPPAPAFEASETSQSGRSGPVE